MAAVRLSAAFLCLLALSLGGKVLTAPAAGEDPQAAFPQKLAAYLAEQGFAPNQGPAGAFFASMTAPPCTIEIAELAPQGWHRSMVEEYAAGRPLIFAFGRAAYAEQPVLQTKLDYYLNKLLGPLHLAAASPVYAVVLTGCGWNDALAADKIAALLG